MSQTNDGGPAFPRPASEESDYDDDVDVPSQDGMSLRDWFAGQALAGLLAFPDAGGEGQPLAKITARVAWEHADAMLAAREAP